MAHKRNYEMSFIDENDLRSPHIPCVFPEEPQFHEGSFIWKEFFSDDSPGKGKGLFMKKCPAGFLIPYGGKFISEQKYLKRRSNKKGLFHPSLSYLFQANVKINGKFVQKGYYDGNPRIQDYIMQSPASYCNEIGKTKPIRPLRSHNQKLISRDCAQDLPHQPTKKRRSERIKNQSDIELYNSRFVVLDMIQYQNKIPKYITNIISENRFQIFLEVMIPINHDQGIELFAAYHKNYNNCHCCHYEPQQENINTRAKGFGLHWEETESAPYLD